MSSHHVDPHLLAFMRYIGAAHRIEAQEPIKHLDAIERYLLEILVKHWAQDQSMTVMQAMALSDVGSPATMHRKITRLRKLGLIEAAHRDDDNRVKYLLPTQAAQDYFIAMSQAMQDGAASLNNGA